MKKKPLTCTISDEAEALILCTADNIREERSVLDLRLQLIAVATAGTAINVAEL